MANIQKNRQRFFDDTLAFLRKQGAFATDSSGRACRYRGDNNTKCAIGKWIPDRKYVPNMEGLTIHNSVLHVIPVWVRACGLDWLQAAQANLHDCPSQSHRDAIHHGLPNDFHKHLEIGAKAFADENHLTYTPPA